MPAAVKDGPKASSLLENVRVFSLKILLHRQGGRGPAQRGGHNAGHL